MKQLYFFIIFLFSVFSFGQSFSDTKGELQISSSGTAVYTLPIAVPPSIKNVAPAINLVYSSGVRGGIAGQGWSINSISTISRMATRRDIDGFVDGVDFDDNDKLALDGQRLLIKTGTYWATGSTYETEYKSNTRIELKVEGTTTYFVVTAPDGSRSWYGSKGSGSLQNSVSLNAWYIVHYEDVNGNFIDYNYKTVPYNNTSQLYIDTITFSGNTAAGIAAQNKIAFFYNSSKRIEKDYLKGQAVYATQILNSIQVYANNVFFRNYQLQHEFDTELGYERIKNITEINGQMEASNPVIFTYASSPSNQERTEKDYINNLSFDKTDLAGDFDGDGRLDFVANNQVFTNLFVSNSGNTPINLPFVIDKANSFTATTISGNKLNQFQSIVNAKVINKTAVEFDIYNLRDGVPQKAYTKSIALDLTKKRNPVTTASGSMLAIKCLEALKDSDLCADPRASYMEGDFDGNGISEVLIFKDTNECDAVVQSFIRDPSYVFNVQDCPVTVTERSGTESFYLLDLDPNQSNALGSKGYMSVSSTDLVIDKFLNVKYIGDFNGDGRSDILQISREGSYKIVEISRADNFAYTKLLGSGVIDKYSFAKQLLLGDFNGDGKTDIMLPDTEGGEGHVKWHIYYSNPNPAGGSLFVKESHDIVEYWPDTSGSSNFKTQVHYSNYYAMDINKDGKSDLVRVWRKYFKDDWTINNHDTEWKVTGFANNIGKVGTAGFTLGYDSGVLFSNSPDIPIPITSNYRFNGADTDLVVVRGHYNKIEYYQFNKNVNTENRLVTVTESGGNIKQTIDYKPMLAAEGLGNSSSDFYSSENGVNYPNIEIIKNSESYLVSKLTATINGVSKYQDFRYKGFVSNFNYGTVGFIRTTRSSWYLSDSDPKIWTTQYNDPMLRGANTITWTSTAGSTVFDNVPSNLVSTKMNVFAVYSKGGRDAVSQISDPDNLNISSPVTSGQTYKATSQITASSVIGSDLAVNYYAPQIVLQPGFTASASNGNAKFSASPVAASAPNAGAPDSNNALFNVLLNKQTVEDHITGIKSETIYSYDGAVDSGNYYGLEVRSVTNSYTGSSLQGSVAVDTQYDNNPSGAGESYYIGRPKRMVSTAVNTASGDTRASEESYVYSGPNLIKTEKKGHSTYAIVEDMTYDVLGNLLTKTVSAPTASPAPAARTIKDEYDSSKRFVIKKTDHQGFVTNFIYNNLGQMTQSTDYMGVISDFVYDGWGKLTNSTVTGSSAIPITTTNVYIKLSTGGYTVATTNSLDAKTITEYDVLGRVVKNSAKGFAVNSMITKQTVYDALGRKEKESEPYFSSPGLWTSYQYDYLMRPTKITAPTGKIQTFSYSGITTTSTDDGKVTTVVVDAMGNKIQTSDPGGTINFLYFANGTLKESDYQGNKVQLVIDGWGNKVKLTDPSAGVYTYSYDAFGQLLTETTPNGTTAYTYDPSGKPTEKTISGTLTNSKTNYFYNGLNQITSTSFVDNTEGKTTTNSYEYDNLKRLYKTTETTPYAVFVKEMSFDTQGRVEKETSTASASGKTSSKTIKNIYQNGFPWQIVDNETQQVLWQSNSLNERAQLTGGTFGNGITVTNSYDEYGYVKQIKHDRTNPSVVNVMTLNTDFEIKRGNLNSRSNSLFGRNETFKYDGLNRLTEYTNGLGIQETQVYDDKGRITQNSVGTYEYDGAKTYQNKAIVPTAEAVGYYTNREGVFNDSMEDRTGFGEVRHPGDIFYSYDDTRAHTGKNSLKLANTTSSEKYVHGDKWINIDNSVATQYTYSAWVYSDSPQAEMVLFMKTPTETGYFSVVDGMVTDVKNQWVKVEKTVTVPAHIKKLNIRLDNNGSGNVWFDDVQIRKTSNAPTSSRALNVTYNTFKSPVQIEETGVDKISFTYNDGNDRSSMFYGSLDDEKLLRPLRKHYSADGTMEIKHNIYTGAVEFVTYIGGDGYSAPVVLKSDGTTQNYLYLHRDYQGTIVAVSDQSGSVVEKRLFDAWGNIVKVQDAAGNILSGLTILDRGYTGHEHLQSVGIIHMNGRLYDPKLHRFLQPDNYIQEPYNTQNYNKYAYVLNNPLKYTDSSGEAYEFAVAVAVAAAIAIFSYTLTALVADVPFSVGGLVKATFIGAASAVVTYGIGSAATSLFTNFYSQAAFQAAAHGTFQGSMTAISGGKFWSGFAAGALSSIAASAWNGGTTTTKYCDGVTGTVTHAGLGVGTGDLGMIAFGTVSGGVGAKLTGGNFWQGAATGLVVSGLNHAAHNIKQRTLIDRAIIKGGYGKELASGEYLNWTNEQIKQFAADVFPELYQSADSPDFEKRLVIDENNPGVAGRALKTPATLDPKTGLWSIKSLRLILIRSNILNSIRQLGLTVGHELNHAQEHVSGVYSDMINRYGGIKAGEISEINAQAWEKYMNFNESILNLGR
ncbi:RHS repeat-associated core domain-containing protein [Flavobacterium olei]|uniref:RHS repeat-associated core domain-containing protein n=1 Tax=Flavobacterium olei TaxID=1886782 RepID=UPI00321ABDD8